MKLFSNSMAMTTFELTYISQTRLAAAVSELSRIEGIESVKPIQDFLNWAQPLTILIQELSLTMRAQLI